MYYIQVAIESFHNLTYQTMYDKKITLRVGASYNFLFRNV